MELKYTVVLHKVKTHSTSHIRVQTVEIFGIHYAFLEVNSGGMMLNNRT